MGKVKKVKKNYQYDRNRKKEWQKKKKKPAISCDQVKEAWDDKKSLKQNLKDMGISTNPNETLKIPKAKELMIGLPKESSTAEPVVSLPIKGHVIEDLEREANIPQRKTLKLSDPDVRYCIYMMEKYGEDYKAMARDKKNFYQDTPKQIRKKINTFKNIPEQYGEYLKTKVTPAEN